MKEKREKDRFRFWYDNQNPKIRLLFQNQMNQAEEKEIEKKKFTKFSDTFSPSWLPNNAIKKSSFMLVCLP